MAASAALLGLLLAGCATSPLGRPQLKLYSDQTVGRMGLQTFQQLQKKTPLSTDARLNAFVNCVAGQLTAQTGYRANWQAKVFQSDEINAFALPGGEIGVYSGLFKVVENQDQLAAVLGHEIGHVIAGHVNERLSDQALTQVALTAAGASGAGQGTMALMGLGAQVGILLPFSRTQESEADLIGLDLMSRAGFDPRQAVVLWQNMQQATAGKAPPELLSDHPADARRIQQIRARLPQDLPIYRQARAGGRQPDCGAAQHAH
ncbi:MAG: M48 family metallopeptidase [Gammaproteobacteria bacterium]|nr:M48 family metallopeptidase [Gammaproteobacteria bacterium]